MLSTILIAIASTALLFNFIWEMLQMPFYIGMSLTDLKDWYLCFRAALGDVAVTMFIYIVGRLIFRDWNWSFEHDLPKVTYLVLVGAAFAVYFEITALESGKWGYSRLMPKLPLLEVGLLPLIQMMVLPALAFRIGLRIAQRFNGA